MDTFIAIPVAQGDAFYLRRGKKWSVLVDGGKSRSALPDLFKKATGACVVDILVCTHNDSDHANGIIGFLEAGLECKEIWLPGNWLSGLDKTLAPWPKLFDQLLKEVSSENFDHIEEPKEGTWLESYASTIDSNDNDNEADEVRIQNSWPSHLTEALERLETESVSFQRVIRTSPFFDLLLEKTSTPRAEIFWSAIKAASRIREIAKLDFHRTIPVRWFDFDATGSPTGGTDNLQPQNAQEITRTYSDPDLRCPGYALGH